MTNTTPPISVQLYSVREASSKNFDQVLDLIAKIGFKGVEPFNLFFKRPADFKQQVNDLGMEVSSTHFPWATRSRDISQVADIVSTLGLSRVPGGFGPDDFKDMDALKRTIDTTQNLVDALKPYDMTLFLHNHYWEYQPINGRPAYHYLQDAVPDVEFQIDTYWVNTGGGDAAQIVESLGERAPLLHIKDGSCEQDSDMVAVGEGKMDFAPIVEASHGTSDWLIVELNRCATDMMEAVEKSYNYLTQNDLARGAT